MTDDKPCPFCGGSGEEQYDWEIIQLESDDFDTLPIYGPCSGCNGAGTLSAAVAQRLEGT
jgi:hypothetical protein